MHVSWLLCLSPLEMLFFAAVVTQFYYIFSGISFDAINVAFNVFSPEKPHLHFLIIVRCKISPFFNERNFFERKLNRDVAEQYCKYLIDCR